MTEIRVIIHNQHRIGSHPVYIKTEIYAATIQPLRINYSLMLPNGFDLEIVFQLFYSPNSPERLFQPGSLFRFERRWLLFHRRFSRVHTQKRVRARAWWFADRSLSHHPKMKEALAFPAF